MSAAAIVGGARRSQSNVSGLDQFEGHHLQPNARTEASGEDTPHQDSPGKIDLLPMDQQNIHYTQTVLESVRGLANPELSQRDSQRVKSSVEDEIKAILNMEVSNTRKMQLVCNLLEEIYKSIDVLRDECRSLSFRGTQQNESPAEPTIEPSVDQKQLDHQRRRRNERSLVESGPRVSQDSYIPRRLDMSQLEQPKSDQKSSYYPSRPRYQHQAEDPRISAGGAVADAQDEMIDIQGYTTYSDHRVAFHAEDDDNPHTFGRRGATQDAERSLNQASQNVRSRQSRLNIEADHHHGGLEKSETETPALPQKLHQMGKSGEFASKNTTIGEGTLGSTLWASGKENHYRNRVRSNTPEPPMRDDGLMTLGMMEHTE